MSKTIGVSEIVAQILVNRGIRTKNTVLSFLKPDLSQLQSYYLLKGLDGAIRCVMSAVARKERIAVYGDYDVDGVTSVCILYKALLKYGADCIYYIPHREEEGYGLNASAITRLKQMDIDLIITCDNGISALAEADLAKELGMKLIVLDHHEPGYIEDANGNRVNVLPKADFVIDPKQNKCAYRFKDLCAAGLSYRFAEALYAIAHMEFHERDEFLVLAALATVCDMAPLLDENRVIVKCGLDKLNKNKQINMGLYAIMAARGITEREITAFEVGFIIGPMLNASGRLEHASKAVELLLADNEHRANELAASLAALNEERKAMTTASADAIRSALEDSTETTDKVLVIYRHEVHESIVGIVAGRIKDTYNKPVILLTDGDGLGADLVKGSARSIEGYNIFESLYAMRDLFERFGGHAMAAGVTLKRENIPTLKRRLNETCTLTEQDFVKVYRIDYALRLEMVTYELARELSALAPYGKDNPEPLFGIKGLKPTQLKFIEEKNTMILTFETIDARQVRAIGFGLNEKFRAEIAKLFDAYECEKILAGVLRTANFLMDMVFTIDVNEYNGSSYVQMKLKDFRLNYKGEDVTA